MVRKVMVGLAALGMAASASVLGVSQASALGPYYGVGRTVNEYYWDAAIATVFVGPGNCATYQAGAQVVINGSPQEKWGATAPSVAYYDTKPYASGYRKGWAKYGTSAFYLPNF